MWNYSDQLIEPKKPKILTTEKTKGLKSEKSLDNIPLQMFYLGQICLWSVSQRSSKKLGIIRTESKEILAGDFIISKILLHAVIKNAHFE